MKIYIATLALVLLAACQSSPRLEDDERYVKLATIVDKHEFTEIERKQAQASRPSDSGVSVSIGMGVGIGSRGMMFGSMMDDHHDRYSRYDEPPQVALGAIRYTAQPVGSQERIEVMSYGQYNVGDCVKVLANHPDEYPRFFEPKVGEYCD